MVSGDFNGDYYEKKCKEQNKIINSIFNKLVKEMPREAVIELLKKKKIIARDYMQKGEKYEEFMNELKEKTREPTLKEQTRDDFALQEREQ